MCSIENMKKITSKSHEQFLDDVYNLNKNIEILTHYTNNKTKVLCRCKIDGHEWYAIPSSILSGSGCPVCGEKSRRNKKRKTNLVFTKEALIKNPEVEILEEYVDSKTKILCSCKLGHTWKAFPSNILKGHGCPICAGRFRYTHEDFMEKFNYLDDSSEYEVLSEYMGSQEKLIFKHKVCNNEFKMTPNNFLRGQRCPYCLKSKGEKKIAKILSDLGINYTKQKVYDNLVGVNDGLLSYDFYLPKYNLLIEYQGIQHEKPIDFSGKNKNVAIEKFKKQKEHDKRKNNYAKQNNIDLLEIWYYDFDNIENILKNYLVA